MKEQTFIITDENGIHARPAGLLAKVVKQLDSSVSIKTTDGKTAGADRLFALMKLGVKKDDTITVVVDGGDEKVSMATVLEFLKEHF